MEVDNQLESLEIFSKWNPVNTENHLNGIKGTVLAEVPFSDVIFIYSPRIVVSYCQKFISKII